MSLGGRGVLARWQRDPGKAQACQRCPWQPRFLLRGWVCRRQLAVALQPQRPRWKLQTCAGCPCPLKTLPGHLVCLGGQGALLHWQRLPGKVPVCPGCPWPPRAHLGGCSSLEGWGVGAVALVEGSCLHHRVTPATAGCVSQAVGGRMAPCPGCEGAVPAGKHAGQGTANLGGGGAFSLG